MKAMSSLWNAVPCAPAATATRQDLFALPKRPVSRKPLIFLIPAIICTCSSRACGGRYSTQGTPCAGSFGGCAAVMLAYLRSEAFLSLALDAVALAGANARPQTLVALADAVKVISNE